MSDEQIQELIAVGCSVTANCHPCIRYHIKQAQALGLDNTRIQQAIIVGQRVRRGAAGEMDKLLKDLAGIDSSDTPGCCG